MEAVTIDLSNIGKELADAETCLPHPNSSGHTECDDWCKLWMILVGVHYLLEQAREYVSSEPLKTALRSAHAYATTLVSATKANAPSNGGAWLAGHFLISAEHRLADALDRLTGLASQLPGRSDVQRRRALLSRHCPRCCRHHFSIECCRLLASSDSALLTVYKRVNVLKHDALEVRVNDVSTSQRFSDAAEALLEAVVLIREFARHAIECNRGIHSPQTAR